MYGDAEFMYDNARGGNDTLNGRGNGDAHEMHDNTRGGNDTLLGGGNGDADSMFTTPAVAMTR